MSDTNGKPKRLDVLIINDEAETPSFLDPMSGKIFVTNRVGKRIMELSDGTRSVGEIATEIAREFGGAQHTTVLEETTVFLQASTGKGLVTWMQG